MPPILNNFLNKFKGQSPFGNLRSFGATPPQPTGQPAEQRGVGIGTSQVGIGAPSNFNQQVGQTGFGPRPAGIGASQAVIPQTIGQPTQSVAQPIQQSTPQAPVAQPAITEQLTPPVGQQPTAQSITGNPQLDAFIQNIPQIQQALGIGVETPEQLAQREQSTTSLNRLIQLQEQLVQQQAPTQAITDLDKMIQEQTQALRATSPEELFRTTPQFQAEGITQGQLQREAAARRAPIAQTLQDLLTSRSIFGEEQQRRQQAVQAQIQGVESIAGLQQAIQKLQPQSGIAPEVQSAVLSNLVQQGLKSPEDVQREQLQLQSLQAQVASETDPINKQLKQAQLAQIQANIAKTLQEAQGTTNVRPIAGANFAPKADLTSQEQQKVQTYEAGILLVDQVEELYKQAVGGEYGGIGSGLLSRAKGLFRSIAPVASDTNFNIYQRFLDSNRAAVAKGLKGEVGNLTEDEQRQALKSFPGKFTSPKEAKKAFENIRRQITDGLSTLGEFDQKPQFGTEGLEAIFNQAIE